MHCSPFDHGIFSPDSGRKSTLEALRNAVTGAASLTTCIGKEGYGKTMLFKRLENELPESYLVISFPSSVDSFDYILQIIALKLDLTFSVDNNSLGNSQLVMELSRILREQKKRLLIIIDEADRLYLATLERIRKMIDLVNTDEVLLQVILFGRPGLQDHIEQLALCTFKDTHEVHLVLPSLTAEDTFQYLNFCMQQRPGSEGKNIFSLEVAAKILTMSHGNFRKINSLAGDSLRSSSHGANETSFMVLLEHVRDTDNPALGKKTAHPLPFMFLRNKMVLGGGALLLLALGLLFSNSEEQKPSIKPTPQEIQISTQSAPPATTPETQEQIAQPVQSEPATEPAIPSGHISPAPAMASETASAQPVPAPAEATIAEPSQPAAPTTTETAANTLQPTIETSVQPLPEAIIPAGTPEPSKAQTIIADKFPRKNKTPLLTSKAIVKNIELQSKITHTLPPKNLAAGKKWLSGEKNDQFTIQLMVLTGSKAEEELTEILRNKENQKESENFIVLKKPTSPPTFILFYGEYPTVASASHARDKLLPALQKYAPYPVSVKQAVKKISGK